MHSGAAQAADASTQVTIIRPVQRIGWSFVRELWSRRELVGALAAREIRAKYAQTVLGVGWALLQPAVSAAVLAFVFGRLANLSSGSIPYPLYTLAGIVPWTFISGGISSAGESVIRFAGMISKAYFPRLAVPIAAVLSRSVDFVIAVAVLLGVELVWGFHPGVNLIALPLIFLALFLTALGPGLWLAAVSVQYRDIPYATGLVLQLGLYAVPVVYPIARVPERFRWLYELNPAVGGIEGFRAVVFDQYPLPMGAMIKSILVATLLVIGGAVFFLRRERVFADVA